MLEINAHELTMKLIDEIEVELKKQLYINDMQHAYVKGLERAIKIIHQMRDTQTKLFEENNKKLISDNDLIN